MANRRTGCSRSAKRLLPCSCSAGTGRKPRRASVASPVLQIQAFHGRQLDSFFRRIVRSVIYEPDQPPAGAIDVENVDAARILFEGAEPLEVKPQSVGQDSAIDAAVSHQQQLLPP